ncbi:CsgG/HfaB family protein [Lignipirellula cremea]|uniref:Curli production assembly/transport component CsgG n=1 Tax=Lignipirellula cremea TaxID=2528010 RepID=A0A518DKX1_9BACT|nr:CsgG/HfaB family protein [Lignipirellula cremea]QDU92489.1 Curli production assembly/transport component CsgG [Lignipirellula cremea]
MKLATALVLSAFFGLALLPAGLQAADEVYPAAVISFQERGADVREMGAQVTDLLFANLAASESLYLVDREDMEKLLKEQELSLSGLVNPDQAVQVGRMTGAKLIVTGSVLQVGEKLILVAKIIGVETTRVVGVTVKGSVRDELDDLVTELAEQVDQAISKRSADLVAKKVSRDDRIAALKKEIGEGARPVVKVSIVERHVGQATIDPAAETEMVLFLRDLGFEVIDSTGGATREADLLIVGEGMSEFAARHGNLLSVKARLEVKVVDPRTTRVYAIDRQTSVKVDLSEQIAGKSALQEASADIAARLMPKLAAFKSEK